MGAAKQHVVAAEGDERDAIFDVIAQLIETEVGIKEALQNPANTEG